MLRFVLAETLSLLMLLSFPAYATTVTITLSVDQSFELYLTPNPRVLTGLIGSGGEGVFTFEAEVTGNRYLMIHGHDQDSDSQYGGILAQASLSDDVFYFQNGGQSVRTGTIWQTFTGSAAVFSPNSLTNPRTQQVGISPNAWWIWGVPNNREARVWVPIFATPVPEPSTLLFLLLGAHAALCVAARNRNRLRA